MKYGIAENHQFVLIDDDLKRLENTLAFMPPYKVEQIAEYGDDEVEQGHDGNWYEKGHAPQKPLNEARSAKLAELNAAFAEASANAHCRSSLGFEINADETANRNVTSLIVALEAAGEETVPFCAFDNRFHDVTLAQLKTMQLDIIANARALYARKWALREAIGKAASVEELDAITIVFSGEHA
ncbi:DUF4376 domain-containing protein [Oxalobacter paraformigenes]|uniref:DUF4376 domain-containing protein n=1 Tax=Oxalobacter paraformigenes TaxID=556268 RepID=T5LEE7_9BURK|nr:DUF4376 domain-containing protein [Oxalobacter paraformigenes]EQM95241.1 hypothetical protein OFAG_02199 [Oxalobacter paraformigenes]